MLYDTQIHCITTLWKNALAHSLWKILKIVPTKAHRTIYTLEQVQCTFYNQTLMT